MPARYRAGNFRLLPRYCLTGRFIVPEMLLTVTKRQVYISAARHTLSLPFGNRQVVPVGNAQCVTFVNIQVVAVGKTQ